MATTIKGDRIVMPAHSTDPSGKIVEDFYFIVSKQK